jgi:hypothetical protein
MGKAPTVSLSGRSTTRKAVDVGGRRRAFSRLGWGTPSNEAVAGLRQLYGLAIPSAVVRRLIRADLHSEKSKACMRLGLDHERADGLRRLDSYKHQKELWYRRWPDVLNWASSWA